MVAIFTVFILIDTEVHKRIQNLYREPILALDKAKKLTRQKCQEPLV